MKNLNKPWKSVVGLKVNGIVSCVDDPPGVVAYIVNG